MRCSACVRLLAGPGASSMPRASVRLRQLTSAGGAACAARPARKSSAGAAPPPPAPAGAAPATPAGSTSGPGLGHAQGRRGGSGRATRGRFASITDPQQAQYWRQPQGWRGVGCQPSLRSHPPIHPPSHPPTHLCSVGQCVLSQRCGAKAEAPHALHAAGTRQAQALGSRGSACAARAQLARSAPQRCARQPGSCRLRLSRRGQPAAAAGLSTQPPTHLKWPNQSGTRLGSVRKKWRSSEASCATSAPTCAAAERVQRRFRAWRVPQMPSNQPADRTVGTSSISCLGAQRPRTSPGADSNSSCSAACASGPCSAPRHAAPPGRNWVKRRRLVAGSLRSRAASELISHCRASLRVLRESWNAFGGGAEWRGVCSRQAAGSSGGGGGGGQRQQSIGGSRALCRAPHQHYGVQGLEQLRQRAALLLHEVGRAARCPGWAIGLPKKQNIVWRRHRAVQGLDQRSPARAASSPPLQSGRAAGQRRSRAALPSGPCGLKQHQTL